MRRSTPAQRRPGRLALAGGLAVALGLAGIAAARTDAQGSDGLTVEVPIRFSHYERPEVTVPAGVAVTFVLHNSDPIDHEWIVGDEAVHQRHRTGTEPTHGSRPTEVTIAAGATARTMVTFTTPGTFRYICHLPGHEAYGMVGTLRVTGQ